MFCLTKIGKRLVLSAALLAAACGAWAQPIKVGWLSSLTGPLSSAALAENQGVQLAVEEINKAGGILGRPIELLTRDTAGDPTQAVNFAQQLAFSDKVQFVIGPVNSGEGLAATPIIARAGVPNLVIGAIDELIDPVKYPRAFRVINTNRQWIEAANAYALGALKGVGEKAMEQLVEERKAKGPFPSLEDFADRIDPRLLNRRQLESLAGGGAFDRRRRDADCIRADARRLHRREDRRPTRPRGRALRW
mgnify:CR=1 FL=1